MMKYSLFYLESFNTVEATVAAAPHEAKPLDPVVGGTGGVPDPAPPVVHALQPGQQELRNIYKESFAPQKGPKSELKNQPTELIPEVN